ncbi:hypothetical protein AB5J62_10910 [Amycolatopsis sp. cg5]|uniref:hypothetical protein n=1 Tax=Amycolatopsis sp. cg5 TaxID=3238802 RepID=UPI0035245863
MAFGVLAAMPAHAKMLDGDAKAKPASTTAAKPPSSKPPAGKPAKATPAPRPTATNSPDSKKGNSAVNHMAASGKKESAPNADRFKGSPAIEQLKKGSGSDKSKKAVPANVSRGSASADAAAQAGLVPGLGVAKVAGETIKIADSAQKSYAKAKGEAPKLNMAASGTKESASGADRFKGSPAVEQLKKGSGSDKSKKAVPANVSRGSASADAAARAGLVPGLGVAKVAGETIKIADSAQKSYAKAKGEAARLNPGRTRQAQKETRLATPPGDIAAAKQKATPLARNATSVRPVSALSIPRPAGIFDDDGTGDDSPWRRLIPGCHTKECGIIAREVVKRSPRVIDDGPGWEGEPIEPDGKGGLGGYKGGGYLIRQRVVGPDGRDLGGVKAGAEGKVEGVVSMKDGVMLGASGFIGARPTGPDMTGNAGPVGVSGAPEAPLGISGHAEIGYTPKQGAKIGAGVKAAQTIQTPEFELDLGLIKVKAQPEVWTGAGADVEGTWATGADNKKHLKLKGGASAAVGGGLNLDFSLPD